MRRLHFTSVVLTLALAIGVLTPVAAAASSAELEVASEQPDEDLKATSGSPAVASRTSVPSHALPELKRPTLPFDFEEPATLYTSKSFPLKGYTPPETLEYRTTNVKQVITGDVDGNATPDLVSYVYVIPSNPAYAQSYVVVQRTDGFGGVEPGTAYEFPGNGGYDDGGLGVADVDGDGDLDVVITTGRSQTIETLLNDGTGGYGAVVSTPTAESLDRNLTLGDVDGDQVLDLVAVAQGAKIVRVYLGNDDGTFRSDASIPVTTGSNAALLDADGDGSLEILVTSWYSYGDSITLWHRATDGTWAAAAGALPVMAASGAWTGDFDGDDDTDIALMLPCGNDDSPCLTPLRNNGGIFAALDSVGFQRPDSPNNRGFPRLDGTTVDIDGDGNLDIVLPGIYGDVGVIFGDGAGSFTDWRTFAGVAGWEPDLEDGWDHASPTSWPSHYGTGLSGTAVAAADFTGDGTVDLAVGTGAAGYQQLAGLTPGRLTLVTGTGPRQFAAARAHPVSERNWRVNRSTEAATLADWDGDGHDDLVTLAVANRTSPPGVLVSPGIQGGFGPPRQVGTVDQLCTGATSAYSLRFVVSDLNGDGALDVACGDYELFVSLGDGAGNLLPSKKLGPATNSIYVDLYTLDATDIDADGDLDIGYVTTDPDGDGLQAGWAENRAGETGGDPTVNGFAPPVVIAEVGVQGDTDYFFSPMRPQIADVTSDGRPDLVVIGTTATGGKYANHVFVLTNEGRQPGGTVTFTQTLIELDVAGNASLPDLLDLDQDGILDLVISTRTSTDNYGDELWEVQTLRGGGDGTFTPLQEFPGGPGLSMRRLADLNGDGNVDLIEPTNYRSVQFRSGNGDGTFGTPQIFGAPGRAMSWVEPLDVDADGDIDIIGRIEPAGSYGTVAPHNLAIMENLGGGSNPQPKTINLTAEALEWQPATGTVADPLTTVTSGKVRIAVTNTGTSAIKDPWTDTVWLSDDDTFSLDDTLVLAVPRSRGLAAGASLDTLHDITLLPHQKGAQHLILRSDTRSQITETDETDNVRVAAPLEFRPPELVLPGPDTPSSATFTSSTQAVLVGIPASNVPLRLTASGDLTGLKVRAGQVPTPTVADQRITEGAGSLVLLPGDYRYLSLDLAAGARTTLTLETLSFGVGSVAPKLASNRGTASFTLTGTGLGRATQVWALAPGGGRIAATGVRLNAEGTLAVRFDLTKKPLGSYAIVVSDGTETSTLPATFRVLDGATGTVRTSVLVPGNVRYDGTGTVLITFANDGLSDVLAPIYRVRSRGATTPAGGPFEIGDFTVIASVPGAPVGVIPPGASGRIEVPFATSGNAIDALGDIKTPRGASFGFVVDETGEGSIAPYDVAEDFASDVADLSDADRAAVVAELTETLGVAGDSYLRGIHEVRRGMARDGQTPPDLSSARRELFDRAVAALPGASLQGTVTDASGAPARFQLLRLETDGAELPSIRTDASGRFATRGVPDGTDVQIFLVGFGPEPLTDATTPATSLRLQAPAWTPVAGTVTDADGHVVAGATVTLTDTATDQSIAATSQIDGTYRFTGIEPSTYQLIAGVDGGRVSTQSLVVGRDPIALDLRLLASSTITGRVLGGLGMPSGGALVRLGDPESGQARTTTTADDGTFTLQGVTPGEAILELQDAGSVTNRSTRTFAPGSTDLGDLMLLAGARVTGKVSDETGGAVAGAIVAGVDGRGVPTGADGRYELWGLESGPVTISVQSSGSVPESRTIDTTISNRVDFVLRAASEATITVTDGGAPAEGILVSLVTESNGAVASSVTDDTGVATIDASPGPHRLAVAGSTRAVTLVAGPNAFSVALATATVTGALPVTKTADGTRPSAEVGVRIQRDGVQGVIATDEDGNFSVEGEAGTTADLWVFDAFLGVLHRRVTFPAAGTSASVGELTPAGHTVTVDLPWMDRLAAPYLRIEPIGGEDGAAAPLLFPDAYGTNAPATAVVVGHDTSLELRNVPDGDYRITVARPGPSDDYEDAVAEFSVNDADVTITPAFPTFGTASGTETTDGSTPLASAPVVLRSTAGTEPLRTYTTSTETDGTWSITVAEGTYTVSVTDPSTGIATERTQTVGDAPRGLRMNARSMMATPAEPTTSPRLAALIDGPAPTAPSKSAIAKILEAKYLPDDPPPLDPIVQMALGRPYPKQPSNPCVTLDFSTLVNAKAKAEKAAATHKMISDAIREIRRQVILGIGLGAARAIIIVNEVISLVNIAKGAATKAVSKATDEATAQATAVQRNFEKSLSNGGLVGGGPSSSWALTLSEKNRLADAFELRTHYEELIKAFLDNSWKIWEKTSSAISSASIPTIKDELTALVDVGKSAGELLLLINKDLKYNPAFGAITNSLSVVSSVVTIYDQITAGIEDYRQTIDLLDNLVAGVEGLYRSLDFDVTQAHAAFEIFLKDGTKSKTKSNCPDAPPPPPPGPSGPGGGWGRPYGSHDPNEIVGVYGVSDERWVQADSILAYRVGFENLGPGTINVPEGAELATAPAAAVTVRLPLPPSVNLDTVAIGDFGFGAGEGEVHYSPPTGAQAFEDVRDFPMTVPSVYDPDETEILMLSLRATAELDRSAREIRWQITLVDPTTGLVHPNPMAGFLPPEPVGNLGAGAGYTNVQFATDDAPTGTTVDARASIVFDTNEPIETNTWSNRLDRTEPNTTITGATKTKVGGLAKVAATDNGSGPGLLDVWRSLDGGPLKLWKYRVDPGDLVLDGPVGQRVGLAARSADQVSNLEPIPTEVQFETVLAASPVDPDPNDPDPNDPDPTTPNPSVPNPSVPNATNPGGPNPGGPNPTNPGGSNDPRPGPTIPARPTPGAIASSGSGRGSDRDDQSRDGLPRTGSDGLPALVSLGLLLLLAGVVLRRRSRPRLKTR